MKLSSVFVTSLSVAVSALTALGFSSQAQALTFSGISSGAWGEPTPGGINTNPVYSGVGTNSFRWGEALPDDLDLGTPQNQLIFEGNSFSTKIGSLFKIGDLTYFNGKVTPNTSVDFVPLNLHVSFGDRPNVSEVFNFGFQLVNTPNDSTNPADNADFVYVGKNFSDRNFTFADKKYTLSLTGFRETGSTTDVSDFRVLEGERTTAGIFAKITEVPPAKTIPEPGTIAGLSLLGIYLISRRKSANS
ncbi:choice-of-anchor K domain-containing protein [Scytonema hofmannii FACHB-248]|uniref:Choice-of-anchor K domain-containing protein n=1 Tax=Scytonema hofmannii FACHB-248 TaxID=1842502 RepID=A0ABR8GRG6_9CYAN|nr:MULTISPECIES: choice-of-anchor K domain-containing protein [Nostocales]MBD2605630.1 choice-of-anchor K domain-containing protein [Scytonema hofmannii FACHB-248]